MKVTIYGAGYVGLVTGVCLADLGHHVLIVDVNAEKITLLQQGKAPIYEPLLEEFLRRNLTAGRLHFTTDLKMGVANGLFQFVAVGTPSAEDGSADLQYVFAVAETIGKTIADYRIVVNKSTVPVGTAVKVNEIIKTQITRRKINVDYDVISNPEFLKQGAAISDFMRPDRIVIGTDNERPLSAVKQLYANFAADENVLMFMDTISAELTKYVANAYLATRISFINEMSRLAELVGADIENIRRGIGSDQRIGQHFLNAGCGFGGSCFPKDVRALRKISAIAGYQSHLLASVEIVNQQQKELLFKKISRYFNGELNNRTIALWGLAFKPNTDDMREATSRILMEALWLSGARVHAYDPAAMEVASQIYGQSEKLKLCKSAEETLVDADVLAIVTEWDEFRNPDFALIKQKLRYPAIFDGRNLYNTKLLADYGFSYYGIGRGLSLSLSNEKEK